METPSSTRRVTRSQASSAASNNCNNVNYIPMSRKIEDSEKGVSKSRPRTGKQQDRSVLIDITNDSPIVGLAMESLETPSSAMSKKRNSGQAKHIKTPGSGEALLRGQVKTLLQKVEEEAELSKLSLEYRPFLHHLQGFVNSPSGLLAPTPANTPLVLNLSDNESFKNSCLASVTPSPVQEQLMISQMVTEMFDGTKQEGPESEKNLMITRSLLLDFSEKSEGSESSECSSVLTHKGGIGGESEGKEKSGVEDDDASVWSIQVNASSRDDDDEEEEEDEDGIDEFEEDDEDYKEHDDDDDGGLVDELCEGMSKISVRIMPKFTGKHTRFIYNSDDELEGEEECSVDESEEASWGVSSGIVRLKGMPTPKGKHLRFPDEGSDEEEEDN